MPAQYRVLEQMNACITRWEQANDRRAIFLACYAQMTSNMFEALHVGEFRDADWVARLLDHFADYYFAALSAYEADQDNAPVVWRYAYDAANRPGTMVLQNLLLGVNAHINYDLVLAVADLLDPEWRELPSAVREIRRADFWHVNQIIARTIDGVQEEIVERHAPWMDLLDKIMGPVDEWFISQLITKWRDAVWDHAIQRVETVEEEQREVLRREVEAAALRWAHLIAGLNI